MTSYTGLNSDPNNNGKHYGTSPKFKSINDSDDQDKITEVKSQINKVKEVMEQNIGIVIDRGEKIEVLEQKSADLADNANKFKKHSRDLKRAMWLKNLKIYACIGIFVAVIITILALVIYFSTKH